MYRWFFAMTIAALAIAGPARAQQPFSTRLPASPDTAQRDEAGQESPGQIERAENVRLALDEFLVLVPFRSEDEIEADIRASRDAEEKAETQKREAEQLERLARDQLDAQKREIDAIKARIKVAKNDDGREAELAVLETDKKLAEGAKKLLEKRRDLRRREIDGWETAARLAVATRRAAELELELARARDELRSAARSPGADVSRQERRVNELEKRTLEAQKERADWRGRVADTEEDVVSSRLELLKTRARIEAGG